ncbi:MAG: hypothetical protein U5K74_05945 [Gemmatimonadaceae bacterium]|nr:hypothetical protein [Gemmatimonadaceae bacterium]
MERLLLRKASLACPEAEGGARQLHQVLGVALVEDREAFADAGVLGRSGACVGGQCAWKVPGNAASLRAGELAPHGRALRAREGEEEDGSAGTPRSIGAPTQYTSMRVLPVPAPATISSEPSPCVTAERCWLAGGSDDGAGVRVTPDLGVTIHDTRVGVPTVA